MTTFIYRIVFTILLSLIVTSIFTQEYWFRIHESLMCEEGIVENEELLEIRYSTVSNMVSLPTKDGGFVVCFSYKERIDSRYRPWLLSSSCLKIDSNGEIEVRAFSGGRYMPFNTDIFRPIIIKEAENGYMFNTEEHTLQDGSCDAPPYNSLSLPAVSLANKNDFSKIATYNLVRPEIHPPNLTDIIPIDDGYFITFTNVLSIFNPDTEEIYYVDTVENKFLYESLEHSEGSFISSGYELLEDATNDLYYQKIDREGNLIWSKLLNYGSQESIVKIEEMQSKNLFFLAQIDSIGHIGIINNITGDIDTILPFVSDSLNEFVTLESMTVEDDIAYIVGSSTSATTNQDVAFAAAIDMNTLLTDWIKFFDIADGECATFGRNINITAERDLAVLAYTSCENKLIFIKTPLTEENNLASSTLQGEVWASEDCGTQNQLLPNILVELTKVPEGQTYYTYLQGSNLATNETNNFESFLSDGNYLVRAVPPNNVFSACSPVPITLSAFDTTETTLFLEPQIEECPIMTVDIITPAVIEGRESNYHINYCNQGTGIATDAYVDIQLDKQLRLISAERDSFEYLTNDSLLIRFYLDSIPVSICGDFSIRTQLSDVEENLAPIGTPILVEANIHPQFDTDCSTDLAYDGSDIVIDAYCEGDTVKFVITNQGDDMDDDLTYVLYSVVTEVSIDLFGEEAGRFRLPSGDSLVIEVPVRPDTTYLFEVENHPLHPNKGIVSIQFEDCESLIIPDQRSPDTAHDLSYVEGSSEGAYQKMATPTGFGNEHYIGKDYILDYKIRFENQEDRYLNNISIRDTLPPQLDITTLKLGASSHNYEFYILNNNILKFVFKNMGLPPGEFGVVSFEIGLKDEIGLDTYIENTAYIYQSGDAGVPTEPVFHTVNDQLALIFWKEELLDTTVSIIKTIPRSVEISPNPTTDYISVDNLVSGTTISLFNIQGKRLYRSAALRQRQTEIDLSTFPRGIYLLEIQHSDHRREVRKVIKM